MEPKILIIDTQPYNPTTQSRALGTYFGSFEKENLFQIFSDSRIPIKGICSHLYQITDKMLFKFIFNKRKKPGRLFKYDDLESDNYINVSLKKKFAPKYKGPLYRFLRNFLWKKNRWLNDKLVKYVDDFKPDLIFVGFSKDFFVFDIASYFSERYNIPIIFSIADDYYFYDEYHFHPFNKMYLKKYRKLVDALLKRSGYCIFESEKIKKKYNEHFTLMSEVVYISSNISCPSIRKINLFDDWFYFGNLEYGRYNSLVDIAESLKLSGKKINVHVYSKDSTKYKSNMSNLILHEQISYKECLKKINEAGAVLIVESFKKKYVEVVKYSLSTKVGDSICSGKPIVSYGDINTGAITFLKENGIGLFATSKKELYNLTNFKDSSVYSDEMLRKQKIIGDQFFKLDVQANKFYEFSKKVINDWKNNYE